MLRLLLWSKHGLAPVTMSLGYESYSSPPSLLFLYSFFPLLSLTLPQPQQGGGGGAQLEPVPPDIWLISSMFRSRIFTISYW